MVIGYISNRRLIKCLSVLIPLGNHTLPHWYFLEDVTEINGTWRCEKPLQEIFKSHPVFCREFLYYFCHENSNISDRDSDMVWTVLCLTKVGNSVHKVAVLEGTCGHLRGQTLYIWVTGKVTSEGAVRPILFLPPGSRYNVLSVLCTYSIFCLLQWGPHRMELMQKPCSWTWKTVS